MKFFISIYNDLKERNGKQIIIISSDKILMSDLKEILYQQFIVTYNFEKLSLNLLNPDIIYNNDSLITFYNNQSNSTIFFDIIKSIDKNKEITLQKHNKIKYKYLLSLGFYNSQKKNYYNEIDELIMIIRENNFKEFESYINKNPIKYPNNYIKNGWNILHYSSYFGNSKVLEYLINKMNININILTENNWSALHLSIFKQNINCIKILINNKNIETNIQINEIGTPLHLAFKMNNYKIILLLLEKCDINIKDSNNKTPFFYLKNTKIKNLLLTKNKKEEIPNKKLNKEKITNQNKNTKYKFLDILPNKKNFPPILYGVVEKTGRLLPIYRLRLIELNPYLGIIKRYKNPLDYPNNPNEIIPILEIRKCKIVKGNNNKEFYFDIEYIDIERYKVYSKKACEEWVNGINKSIEFCDYFHTLKKNFDNVNQFLIEFKPDTYEILKETGKLIKIISHQDNDINNKLNINNLNQNEFFSNNNLNEKTIKFKDFEILKIIGNGTFGKVFKVKCLLDNKIYAMKVLRKKFLLDNNQLKYALSEIKILKKCSHPFIIKLHFSFQTPSNLYLIIDYCSKGDLSLLLQTKKNLTEKEIKFYISELILSIEYLHNKNILYRDLKPENILITKDNHIKLCDFGLAKENDSYNFRAKTFCGSLLYISPEMLCKKGINNKGDIYSIGIIIYELFYGKTPFNGNNINELINNILNYNINFDSDIFISEDFKSLILGMLNKDENLRFDMNDIKKHSFFKDVIWEDVYNKKIKPFEFNIDNYNENNNKIVFNFKDNDYNEENINFRRIIGFTFIKSSFKEVINNDDKNEIKDNKNSNEI